MDRSSLKILLSEVLGIIVMLGVMGCGEALDTPTVNNTEEVVEAIPWSEVDCEKTNLFETWISVMDPYVTQNTDWTWKFDEKGFVDSLQEDYPDVYAYFTGNGTPNEDTEVIESLRDGILVANEIMREIYEALQELPDDAHIWITNNTYWFGRMSCFGGSDDNWMLNIMKSSTNAATIIAGYVRAPVSIVRLYLSTMISTAEWCSANRDYFCIVYTWTGIMYVTCG